MSRPLPLLLAATFLSLALAGCIQVPGMDGEAGASTRMSADARDAGGDAKMDAREEKREEAGACSRGWCITQTVRAGGAISDLPLLEVDLGTLNGGIQVTGGPEGSWRMVATLTTKASSREAAEAAMRDLTFAWAHHDGGSHFLEAKAEFRGRHEDVQRGADIEVVLPRSLVLRLVADTTNGGISVRGVRTDGLSADTTNGGVTVDADVTQVDLGTTNGGIEANLRPTASGRITLDTTNGRVALTLPEGETLGYDLEGSTTNGEVDVSLRDGTVGPCPQGSQYYTPPCNHRTFKTRDYESRAIRSQVQVGSTNGGIDVRPA